MAIESVTGRARNQRFARFRFHNFAKKSATTGALKIDSGTGVNTMPLKEYKRLHQNQFSQDGTLIRSYLMCDDQTMKTKLRG